MKRTVWKCSACNGCGVIQPCVLITLDMHVSVDIGRCPASQPNNECKWKKISECEIPDETDAQYARE